MSKTEYWRQCTLAKDNTQTVAWIQEWAAKVGTVIKSSEDNELNGFQVLAVSETRLSDEAARETDRLYKKFHDGGSLAKQKAM